MTEADFITNGLTPEAKDFINKNLKENTQKLRLKYAKKSNLPYPFLINQIDARQRLQTKNPDWAKNPNIIFPKKLSVEQSSSEITANYKAKLIAGENLIDLTGGLGIDSFAFAEVFKTVVYTDLDPTLCKIAAQNAKTLNLKNVEVINGNSIEILKSKNTVFDCIYVDPARRSEGKKMVSLKDCFPDVVENLELLLQYSKIILIKASPFLDLKKGLLELKYVKEIHVVSVKNDCKEILFLVEKDFTGIPEVFTVNITSSAKAQKLSSPFPDQLSAKFSDVKTYIYEPNASIMKAGIFGKLCKYFDFYKLHPNSNVYTSNIWLPNFTGKKFKVLNTHAPYKQKFKGEYLNIVTRNFRQKPEEIKKKLKSKDGGARFLFATTNYLNKPIFILCIITDE